MTPTSKIWKSFTPILSNLHNFYSLEVVGRVSETQLQVGEISNWIIWRLNGLDGSYWPIKREGGSVYYSTYQKTIICNKSSSYNLSDQTTWTMRWNGWKKLTTTQMGKTIILIWYSAMLGYSRQLILSITVLSLDTLSKSYVKSSYVKSFTILSYCKKNIHAKRFMKVICLQ